MISAVAGFSSSVLESQGPRLERVNWGNTLPVTLLVVPGARRGGEVFQCCLQQNDLLVLPHVDHKVLLHVVFLGGRKLAASVGTGKPC